MTKRLQPEQMPDWPRLMPRLLAAAYVGISPSHFDGHCPIEPILWAGKKLWDRRALDEWIDRKGARPRSFEDTGELWDADAH